MTARVTIARTSAQDVRDRQIYISLDGARIATLMYGDTVTREVEPGRHRVRANNTLVWKTRVFDVAPDEHARFTVVNRPGVGTYTMLGLLGAGPIYLTLEREG